MLGALLFWNMQRLERHLYAESANLPLTSDTNVPPTLALTTFALGPLRGLIVDGLWWRMIQLQSQGDHFETMQLTEWITALQPRFPQVWAFGAWNFSYNVAYEFGDPMDRWKWVDRGIRLLRDDGLRYNPNDPVIRRELARIFLDRIGGRMDPAQEIFKREWALTVMRYLKRGDREELVQLSDARKNRQTLTARPDVAALLSDARELGLDLLDPEQALDESRRTDAQKKLFQEDAHRAAWADLQRLASSAGLLANLKLDVDRMLFVDREYGPFDWRLSQAHAVYWAAGDQPFADFLPHGEDETQLTVMVRQAMEQSFQNGRLIYDEKTGFFLTTNNVAIVGKIHDYYGYLMEHHFSQGVDALHRMFLEEAMAILYSNNLIASAKRLYHHYAEDYMSGPDRQPFEDFALRQMNRILQTNTTTDNRSIVNAALTQGCFWYAAGETQKAAGYLRMARDVWERHQRKYASDPGHLLPPFETMREGVLRGLAQSNLAVELQARLSSAASGLDRLKEFNSETGDNLYLGHHGEDEHEAEPPPGRTDARGPDAK
ncbi:MAG: hypothetical protein A3K19_21975 [Lentisphaerae bacterium RIFOXYB12_FULL_65_16]|nr:MAG: hypothetical protein A3K18_04275 [Lentisphaerae bacterium RIFOXYA12_64_32]OGV93926.1 MAG: hypothetical protein A3K19_21975 [Lentisphaerae bacterium RIFOXYB12_FULL_65_16]